ncbi:MAG: rRNA maturation RNase YbeY [bacterium]
MGSGKIKTVEIDIIEHTPSPDIGIEKLRQVLEKTLEAAGETDVEVAVSLVDDERMRDLSRRFLDKDAATDVLSFAQRDEAQQRSRHLGDIVISMETARRQAATAGHSASVEVCHLAEHGLLHLLGYEHDKMGQGEWNDAALRFGLLHHVLNVERE